MLKKYSLKFFQADLVKLIQFILNEVLLCLLIIMVFFHVSDILI